MQCKNICDTILENYPKSKAAFYEEAGVEDDAEAGVDVNAFDPDNITVPT